MVKYRRNDQSSRGFITGGPVNALPLTSAISDGNRKDREPCRRETLDMWNPNHRESRVAQSKSQQTTAPALLSLELMPGLTITSVLIVDNPGNSTAVLSFLKHASWNGFTPADCVFPAFLCMIGTHTLLSHVEKEGKGASQTSLLLSSLWRALYLSGIGLLLDALYLHPWSSMLILGVLQRVGLCLACGSLLLAGTRSLQSRWIVLPGALLVVLVGYWLLLRFVPVPGFGVPGGNVPFLDPTHNLPFWLDNKLFAGHLLHGSSDPNGLLSTIPAVGTFLIGMIIGLWLKTSHTLTQKATGLVAAGCASLAAGGLWSRSFPINMQLWTSSYVLWSAGWTLLALALLFIVADVWHKRGDLWSILLVFGTNAMSSFIFASAISTCFSSIQVNGKDTVGLLYGKFFASIKPSMLGSMLYSLLFTAACWLLMRELYRRRIVLNI